MKLCEMVIGVSWADVVFSNSTSELLVVWMQIIVLEKFLHFTFYR